MFAFIESAVGDALEKLGVMGQRTYVAPADVIRAVSEVIAAECLEPVKHRIYLHLPGHKGLNGLGIVGGVHRNLRS